MVKTKGPSKKQQKRGIDFKKIKRKIGRKLPPPKNATNTEIKTKAIILPEQSVASDKAGLAVSKKGLTLKELLQQSSHHSPKVRKDALAGMKDLILNYPEELKLHGYVVIEKLRERISDDDKVVRQDLYQLLKTVILPGCKEDNQELIISLMMTYIFNAMTHLAIDIRLMAFNFFDLLVQYYPPSFSLHYEKILHNYEGILQKNQFYLQDKAKLKNAFTGLVRCLSLLPSGERKADSSEKESLGQEILHAFEPDLPAESSEYTVIATKLKYLVPVLVSCFQDFIQLNHHRLDAQPFDCMRSILQSIDLAISFFIHGIHKGNLESDLPCSGKEMNLWDHSVSSVLLKKLLVGFPLSPMSHLSEKDEDRYFVLNVLMAKIFLHLSEWIPPPVELLEKFLEFIEHALLGKVCSNTHTGKVIQEKQMLALIPFIPKLVPQVVYSWKCRLLQAFTQTFQDCNPGSSLKLACLAAIEEMLISREEMLCSDVSDSGLQDYQISWITELPRLLTLLGNKHPSSSQVVLRLLLRLGQRSFINYFLASEYDKMQYALIDFYSRSQEEAGNICYGPFINLARDAQDLAVCCLYYFSRVDSLLLKSIASCCLCHELDPFMLFRIVEVMHSAYNAGHIDIVDHISFFITLVSRFKVMAGGSDPKMSNCGTFKSMTSVVCSYLSQMGDNSLVFLTLEKVIIEQMSLNPPLDNACAMLRILVTLDSKPTRISEQSILTLSSVIPAYLMDVVRLVPADENGTTGSNQLQERHYYVLPCFFFFDRSHKLLSLVLDAMGSLISENRPLPSVDHGPSARGHSSRINAIVSVIVLMYKDAKVRQILSSSKAKIDQILKSIQCVQSSKEIDLTIDERYKIQHALDQLNAVSISLVQRMQAT